MNSKETGFKLIKSTYINSLGVDYEEYVHNKTKARHIHLGSDNDENVFIVALRTVPEDSSGVAHVLEHTSLCGSEKFPVRDPFFMMTRRSLNTFMNAFTSSDWTAYPFATKNKKDFDNLLQVYLDAVFFARLDPLDFAQEGHRLEFAEINNPKSELLNKGVVYNEMKGAMSAITSQLWQAVGEELFPGTTYGVNSGGEPKNITDLKYDQLINFYKTHYHPNNSIFMTFGDIPAIDHQDKLNKLVLEKFNTNHKNISVPFQKRFDKPKRAQKFYPIPEGETDENKSHLLMAWIIGDIKNPFDLLANYLLSSFLLENSACPLRKALETTEIGSNASPLCGLDDSGLEMVFICGIEGANASSTQAFESLIINTLNEILDEEIDFDFLSSLLDQLELQQREIGGSNYPYGLQLILSGLPTAIHRGDIDSVLNIDPILSKLRSLIKNPKFIKSKIKDLLIDNTHRVTITMAPDEGLTKKMISDEKKKLDQIKSNLSEEQKKKIILNTNALLERQNMTDDPDVLPKVEICDIPSMVNIDAEELKTDDIPVNFTFYPQKTNGLYYQDIITPINSINEKDFPLFKIHNMIITELGIGNKNYLETQHLQTKVCGGIKGFTNFFSNTDNPNNIYANFVLSSKGLNRYKGDVNKLLNETYYKVKFNETKRIHELIKQARNRSEQKITGNGHVLAMKIASQNISHLSRLQHNTTGIMGIKNLFNLEEELVKENKLDHTCQKLNDLHNIIKNNPPSVLIVAEKNLYNDCINMSNETWLANDLEPNNNILVKNSQQTTNEIWVCNTQVNFCAKSYKTVTLKHDDAPALTVLGVFLRNGYLHTSIREKGGAYGGGATQDNTIGGFKFYSYRDPRLSETLDDFDSSILWLMNTNHERRLIDEAIISVIASLDKPSSPSQTAKLNFYNKIKGLRPEDEHKFRQKILDIKQNDLKEVAEKYLTRENANIGIISNKNEMKKQKLLVEEKNAKIFEL